MFVRMLSVASLVLGSLLPSPPQQRPAPPAIQERTFNLPANSSGDCRMTSGKITIYSNGTGLFQATTLTYHTHSGDVWHIQLFSRSAGNTVLFATSYFNSPRMNDGNPPPSYNWQGSFTFDRTLYNTVAGFDAHSNC